MSTARRGHVLKLFTAAAAAALTAFLGLPAAARATTIDYAALGDSYSSGVGADGYFSAGGRCYRGSHAYPVLWAAAHSASGFAFAACSGATTADVRAYQLGVLSTATTLVTITIGGNDIGFADVVIICKLGSTSACANAVSGAEDKARTTFPAALAATYADIKAKAPDARLIVLGYPRLFETGWCGLFAMSRANRKALNGGADVLESVISAQARASGATYVSVNAQFQGHRICASTPWINGTAFVLLDSYHPKAAGYSHAYLPALTTVTG